MTAQTLARARTRSPLLLPLCTHPHYVLKINRRWPPLRHDCQYSDLRLFESCLKSDNWLAGTVPSHPLFSSCCFPQRRAWQTERQCYSSRRQQYELLAVKSCLTLNKSRESYIKLCVSFAMLLLWWNMQDPVWQNIRCEHVNSVTLCVRAWRDILRTFPGWLVWIKSLLSFVSVWWFWWVCVCVFVIVCAGAPDCRSPTPFSRATLSQRCGGSSVWAMPSCSVPLSSSWGACFSWPPRCFSWMTGRRPRNSKWLRHCLNNSSLFHLLFSHLFFKYLKHAWDVLHWLQKSKHTTSEEVAIILLLIWVPYRHTKVWDFISTVLCYLTPMLGFDVCQGQAAQWCQQWCQPCKTQKGPLANRKSQSAKSAPELTQAVLAINLLKCAYLDFYQLPPSHSCIHIFLFQTPKTWTQRARELVMALKG